MSFKATSIDARQTIAEFAGSVNRSVAEIVEAIESGKLKHLCKDGVLTVSQREWADYCRKEAR